MERGTVWARRSLRVRQFHGFAACPQLVSACHFVESRISADFREDGLTLAQFDALVGCGRRARSVSRNWRALCW